MPRKSKKVVEEPTENTEEVEKPKPKAKRKRAAEQRRLKNKSDDTPKVPKKRRKPKGGKIITAITPAENVIVPEPNIILHLKCGMSLKIQSFFKSMFEI